MQVMELPQDRHPFFMATQAHPELTSRPLQPQPMFVGLVRASLERSGVAVESLPGPDAADADPSGPVGTTTTSA
jgi:CTP synthase